MSQPRSDRLNVMLVSPSMQAGGAERVLTLLACELSARGHHVCLAAPRGPRDRDLEGVPHARIDLHDRGRTLGLALETIELARAIRRVRPAIVHAQNPRLAAMTRVAAMLAGPQKRTPVLATFHGVLPSEYGGAARLLRIADHTVCVSSDLREQIMAAGLASEKTSVIYNAVERIEPLDTPQRESIDAELGLDGAPVAAVVARIVPQKAHDRFVRAAAVAVARVPSLRLLVIGDGPLRAQTEAAVKACGLTESFIFTGVRSDARRLIERADVLVFSSDWEGMSIAALEAMAAGVPVLSTDVQGMRELFASGAGEVVPLDEGLALGERLADLVLDRQRRQTMGAAGLALIDSRHTASAMTDAYESRYRRLLAG